MSNSAVQEFKTIIMEHAFPEGSASSLTLDEIQKVVFKYADMPHSVTTRRVRDALDALWTDNQLLYQYPHNGIKLMWKRRPQA